MVESPMKISTKKLRSKGTIFLVTKVLPIAFYKKENDTKYKYEQNVDGREKSWIKELLAKSRFYTNLLKLLFLKWEQSSQDFSN